MRHWRRRASGLIVPDHEQGAKHPLSMGAPQQALLMLASVVYSAWNPSDKDADVTLSVNDTVATVAGANGAVRGVQGRDASENRYFEILQSGTDLNSLWGVGTSSATLANFPGADANGYAFYPLSNQSYRSGAPVANPYFVSTTIGVDFNIDAGTLVFVTPGRFRQTAFTGLSGTYYPMWGPGTSGAGTRTGTINTGGSAFTFALPPGATAWGGTWNSADKDADVTLSGGDLIASVTAAHGSVRGTQSRASGHYYFEVTYSGTDSTQLMGVGTSSATLAFYPGRDANGKAWFESLAVPYTSDAAQSNQQATSGYVGVWLNAGVVKFITDYFVGVTAWSGLSGTFYPMWGPGTSSGTRSATLNTGGSSFIYSQAIAAGASAWG